MSVMGYYFEPCHSEIDENSCHPKKVERLPSSSTLTTLKAQATSKFIGKLIKDNNQQKHHLNNALATFRYKNHLRLYSPNKVALRLGIATSQVINLFVLA